MKGGSIPKVDEKPPQKKSGKDIDSNDNDAPKNPVLLFGSSNNIFEGDDEGKINFREEEDDDEYGGGIELCAHQPTFVNLDSLVPRGYASVLELPKAVIEAPSKTIPQNQNSVLPSESLSQMKLRNKDKWSEIGYDPNSGKGNLKCSYTLSQFRPSSLLGNLDTISEKKETTTTIKEEDEDISKGPDQNKKEPKKSQGRINSSEGKRKKYALSDSDEEEEKKVTQESENENEEEQKPFGDISMLLDQPLIQANETETEIEEEEEEEEAKETKMESIIEENQSNNDNEKEAKVEETKTKNIETKNDENKKETSEIKNSKIEKDKKQKKDNLKLNDKKKKTNQNKQTNHKDDKNQTPQSTPNKSKPSYNEKYNMFLTQIQEQKIQRSSKSDDDEILKKKDTNAQKSNDLEKAYQIESTFYKKSAKSSKRSASSIVSRSPKIYQPFPSYQPKPPLNLSPYDDEDFDEEKGKSKIPPKLLEMIHHSPKSIVFRSLCQEDISSYPKKVLNQVVSELKVYLQKCIKNNMIGESSYVDCIINNIKIDIQNSSKSRNDNEKINQKIDQTEISFEDRKHHWKEKKNILEVERDIALEDLDLKNQQDIQSLEDKWNSEKMQAKYNKPSPKLLELRQNARALIAAHNFDEAQKLAEQIAEQEAYETNQALARMQREYKQAQVHLSQKYNADRKAMCDSFESKLNGIIISEANDLLPLEQRIGNLQKIKKNMEMSKKTNPKSCSNFSSQQKKIPVAAKTPPLSMSAKLKLPPLKSVQAKRSDSKTCVMKK